MTTRRITRITAENFMRLKAVDISPEGDVVYITGANGEGKSSILNAICAALNWRDVSGDIPEPIHKGKQKAVVSIDLGEPGSPSDMIVTRTWTPAGTQLKVESKEGAVFKSPQAMLDKFFSRVGFDPLEFIRMPPKDQRQTLMDLLGIDFSEFDVEKTELLRYKTDVDNQIKRYKLELGEYPEVPDGTPDEEISAVDLVQRIQKSTHLSLKEEDLMRDRQNTSNEISKIDDTIKDLENKRRILEKLHNEISEKLTKLELPEPIEPLKVQLADLEQINKQVRVKQRRNTISTMLKESEEEARIYTQNISCIDQYKRDALEAAKFPVKGLSFDETGVIFNGIPLKQASSAEQIRVSLAIGISMNPSLKVLLIRDGSLMDTNTRQIVADLAAKHGMQVWIEAVDESGMVGFTIDDGTVRPPVDPVQQVIA